MKYLVSALLVTLATSAHANVVGVDTQNFNPTTSGLDFVTVQSSETLSPGVVNFGLFFNYAINTLPNYTDTTTQSRSQARDKLLSSDVNVGVGLLPRWDVGISFPAVLSQQVEDNIFKGVFEKTGLTDVRINTKVQMSGDKSGGTALIATLELPQVENNPFGGTGNNPTLNLEFAADTTYNKVAMGLNLGYRIRQPGDPIPQVPIDPVDDMYIASIAGSYLFESIDTKLISEIYASQPVKKTTTQSDRDLTTAEWLVGFKHDVTTSLALHGGLGTELLHGSFTPDWRVYAGLNWAVGPVWGQQSTEQRMSVPVPVANQRSDEDVLNGPSSATTMTDVAAVKTDGADLEGRNPENKELFVVLNINFATDSAKIPLEFRQYLEKFANYLKKPPAYKRIVISGHTDSVGGDDYNLRLSRERAITVKRAFVEVFGLDADRIQVEGFGETRPVADNGNYQGRAQNRRVEFYIER